MPQAMAMQGLPAFFNNGRIDLENGMSVWAAAGPTDEGKIGLVILAKDDDGYVMASPEEVASVAADEVALSLLQDLLSLDPTGIAALYDHPMEMLRGYLPVSVPQMRHWVDDLWSVDE